MKNEITIIGGSGFIGASLVSLLSQKEIPFKIVDINIRNSFPNKSHLADIRSLEGLRKAISANSVLVNLAAEHRDDVSPLSLYDEVNVDGANNLCKVAVELGIEKIVFTSSVAVYGFALPGTDESGVINPFNNYGRTKWEAEQIYAEWQAKDPQNRTLVIVRPTVVFGERNRGNVYNLLKQIATGRFIMVGSGLNRKSMAYVENVAAFLEYSLKFKPGVHIYNYIDKPNLTMASLVELVSKILDKPIKNKFRIPFFLGLSIGVTFDIFAKLANRKFAISAIRVRKFCTDSVYDSAVQSSGFTPPVPLIHAIERTIKFEFIKKTKFDRVFYSE